jgi:acyl-coenzyme A synthetase/AMP-(fatty) acid ligase
MFIKSLINKKIFESKFELFDPKGISVDCAKFKSDYIKIRNYVSNHCIDGGIGISLPKDHRFMLTMMACMDVGVFYVPIKSDYPKNRICQIKEETEYTVLIDETKFSEIISTEAVTYIETEISENDTLYKICTSGSTGRPKAVVVPRVAMENFWKWVNDKFSNVNETDVALQVTEFTFDISLIDVALFLTRGCKLYFSGFTGSIFTLAYEIETYKVTTLNTVVNNVNMLLDDNVVSRADYSNLHTVMMGGARFSYGLYKKCKEHFSDIGVHNLYGVTEVPVYSHCKTMNFDESDLNEFTVSVGKPLGTCTALIHNTEVLMGGGSLMKGYANNPEKTAEVFTQFEGQKYYRSGDIGFINENGDYFITGRMDDTIKYRGYRVNLLDIDSYILSKEYVQDAVTIAVENEETQNQTVCFVISKNDISEKEMKKDLADVLLDYQIPEKIYFIKAYPTNVSGKVCKKTLKKEYIEGKYNG